MSFHIYVNQRQPNKKAHPKVLEFSVKSHGAGYHDPSQHRAASLSIAFQILLFSLYFINFSTLLIFQLRSANSPHIVQNNFYDSEMVPQRRLAEDQKT